ncbi:GDSL-type esterase/lipase family protein [Burkholderia sp. Bp9143]|uniref:SGNH/GDSL hydrolase family protein n=1 Tax=Burkholderia sp. Bp9143 TaxID=2184574 RepID=UPI0021AB43A7|nr:GDSL-type esterase/lipase family protein [Burkholderia sp. Bp9143]
MYGYQKINGKFVQTQNTTPLVLQNALRAKFGPTVTVENHGIGGADIKSAVYGLAPFYSLPLAKRLSTQPAQIVLANYGINDSRPGNVSESDYRAALEKFVDDVRAAGETPLLEEPNPTCDVKHKNLGAYVAIMRDVATSKGVTLIAQYDYIRSLPNWKSMLTDCVHPKDELYAVKAQRESQVLEPMVAKLQQ